MQCTWQGNSNKNKIIKQNYKFSTLARKITLLYSNSSTDGTKIRIQLKLRIFNERIKISWIWEENVQYLAENCSLLSETKYVWSFYNFWLIPNIPNSWKNVQRFIPKEKCENRSLEYSENSVLTLQLIISTVRNFKSLFFIPQKFSNNHFTGNSFN